MRAVSLAAALALVALFASGCGGSKAPSVARLETTTASGGASSGASALAPGNLVSGSNMSVDVGTGGAGVAYAACMRAHGLPKYPDPDAHGVITITVSAALDPASPAFRRAVAACGHLVPAGKGPSPAQQQRMRAAALGFAKCMRAHGVPGYPDPTFGPGGTVSQGLDARAIHPRSPIFQAAQKTCRRR